MYKDQLGIPAEHEFVQTSSRNEQRKGRDTDIYDYDEKDENGNLIAKYTIRESMSIYPPQTNTISYKKYDVDGKEIKSGTLK